MTHKMIGMILVLTLFVPLLSGCWDSLDIEKRATVLAIAIDKADSKSVKQEDNIAHFPERPPTSEQKLLQITAQVSVPGRIPLGPEITGDTGGNTKPVWVLTTVGHTLDDALLNLQQELADKLFLGHLRMVVISEEVAKEGVEKFNDYLRRQPEIRRTIWMAVSEEKATDYMRIAPKLERVPALYLTSMVKQAVDLGKFPQDDIGIFWRTLSSKGQDGYLPYLQIKGSENIELKGLAYFKGEKMKGIIDPIEIGSHMAVLGQTEGGYGAYYKVPDTDGYVLVRAIRRRSKVKTIMENGQPEVKVRIHYESEVTENEDSHVKLDDPLIITKIEEQVSKDISQSLRDLITKMQKEGSDIFGFGEQIRAKQPAYWRKHIKTKEKWRKFFQEMNIKIEMETTIERTGSKAE